MKILQTASGIVLALFFYVITQVQAASITVNVNNELKDVNYGVLGANVIGYYRTNWNLTHYINGDGIWDVDNNQTIPEIQGYANDIGIQYSRFPGGIHIYDWKLAVGPIGLRPGIRDENGDGIDETITFGLPEFLQNCDDFGSVPVILVPEITGTKEAAADMVKYLNTPCTGTCTTAIDITNYDAVCNPAYSSEDWPQLRVCDKYALGRSDLDETWGVKWFEYGNETNSGHMTATDYISSFVEYRDVMRAVMEEAYPGQEEYQVKLGAVLENYPWATLSTGSWDHKVIQGTSQTADFYIVHAYVPWYPADVGTSIDSLIELGLAGTNGQLELYFQRLNNLIFDLTGRNIPIAITEFNSGLSHSPVPDHPTYQDTLGSALINADLIHQFMHADNVEIATYFHLPQMIKSSGGIYTLRPAYYAFQFYNNYFGDRLIESEVITNVYGVDAEQYRVKPADGIHQDEILYENLLLDSYGNNLPWTITAVAGLGASETDGVLTVQFDGTEDVDYYHSSKYADIEPGTVYRLSGLIRTVNLTSNEGVYLAVKSGANAVVNGDFENGLDNWKRFSTPPAGTVQEGIISDNKYDGSQSIKVMFTGSDGMYFTCNDVILEPETNYVLEGYIMTQGLINPANNTMHIQVRDIRGYSYGGWQTPGLYSGDNNWTHVSKEFITKDDTGQVKVCFGKYGGPVDGTVWWDGISLINKTTTEKVRGTEGNNLYWQYVFADFTSQSGIDSTAVFVGRNADGFPGGQYISGTAEIRDVKLRKLIPGNYGAVPYLSVNASKNTNGNEVSLMVINRSITDYITAPINLNGLIPSSAETWSLGGDSVDASDEHGVVYNSGFEDIIDFKSWVHSGKPGISIVVDKAESHAGSRSVRFDFNGTDVSYGDTYQNIYVEPNTTYKVEGYGKADISGTTNGMMIYVADYNHGGDFGTTEEIMDTDDWTYVNHEFTTNQDTARIQIGMKRRSGSGPIIGSTWWDDVTLTKISGNNGNYITLTNSGPSPTTDGFQYTFSPHSLTAIKIYGLIDSDGDKMSDEFENQYSLNPDDPADAVIDNDNDELTNLQEYQVGTNPEDSDTDDDGISDGDDPCPLDPPVRLSGTSQYFSTLQAAYDNGTNMDTLISQSGVFEESILFDQDKSITLQGGYNCSHSVPNGVTAISGDIRITDGTVTVTDFIVQ